MPDKKIPLGFLIFLAMLGIVSVLFFGNIKGTIILMLLSYASNAAYSMQSRSGVRNSGTYHAFTILLGNIIFYQVLHQLVKSDLTLSLFIPYTVATVWGSATGAKFSMGIEKRFGITTSTEKISSTKRAIYAKRLLMIFLGVATVAIGLWRESIVLFLTLSALQFFDGMTHSWLRRARNTSNAWYHISVSILKSAVWFFLFKYLVQSGMPIDLFVAYCFGSVLGGVAGQETSLRIERWIGAGTDKHLKDKSIKIIPWNVVMLLGAAIFLSVAAAPNILSAVFIVLLAGGQQVAFSLVSRSRNRSNLLYHVIASVFSNGIWFLTFRQLNVQDWTIDLYIPYAVGSALGSVAGVSASMGIERKLNIKSD